MDWELLADFLTWLVKAHWPWLAIMLALVVLDEILFRRLHREQRQRIPKPHYFRRRRK